MQYTDEEKEQLIDRWIKPLLDPDTKQPTEVEGCKTFQELLAKRLKEIKEVLLPEIEKVDESLGFYNKRREYRKIWQKNAEKKFKETMLDIKKYGLKDYIEHIEIIGFVNYMELIDGQNFFDRNYSIDLRGAFLASKHFIGADCSEANFEGANCINAHFDGTYCSGAHFEGAYCCEAHFDGANCVFAHFDGASCSEAHFEGADCTGAHFDGAICINAHFNDADCIDTHFDGANCSGAHFESARCDEISFGAFEKIDENRVIHRVPCNLSEVTYKGATFLNVDTSNVDWTKNPGMKSEIEHQQFKQYIWNKVKNTKFGRFLFKVWGKTSNYGKSFWRWLGYCAAIIIIFTGFYCGLNWLLNYFFNLDAFYISDKIVNTPSRIFSYLYFSVVTFSTLGFGDVTPIHLVSMILVMVEVILGYIMLGGLITFLVKWLGRK